MQITRIVKSKCGTVNMCGGAVVSVDHLGEYYGTKINTPADLMNIVASCNKGLLKQYGLKKFSSKEDALKYASA